MKRIIALICIIMLLFTGCSDFLDGSYVSVTPHEQQNSQGGSQSVSVRNYSQLVSTLLEMVKDGQENGIISVAEYDQKRISADMERAVEQIMTQDPICAYAVSEITYDLGTSAGQPAVALSLSYIHNRSQIRGIKRYGTWEDAWTAVSNALNNCESGIVLYIEKYEEVDLDQWVYDYATANPNRVMERPAVSTSLYPERGEERVVELKFIYQNSRDALRTMQSTVQQLFSAAAIYAGGYGAEEERFFKLYSFLMGTSPEFQLETSITPAYSLLQHGIGDSRAFATIYAAMCAQAGLECISVTGNDKDGEPWFWNIICCDGVYYHLNLLACYGNDLFYLGTDEDMRNGGYVWDYAAYPECAAQEEIIEE